MSQNPKTYVAQAFIRAENCRTRMQRKEGRGPFWQVSEEGRRGVHFWQSVREGTADVAAIRNNPCRQSNDNNNKNKITRWKRLQCQPTVFQNDLRTCGNGPENSILYCGGNHDGKQDPKSSIGGTRKRESDQVYTQQRRRRRRRRRQGVICNSPLSHTLKTKKNSTVTTIEPQFRKITHVALFAQSVVLDFDY
jgi:hypothetical protein